MFYAHPEPAQYATYADLDGFYTRFRPDAVGTNFTFYSVSGMLSQDEMDAGQGVLLSDVY